MKKFVRSSTLARLKKLNAELKRAAQDPEDQKAIHDLRVAIRRFTQCLRSFGQFFDSTRIKRVRRRLRKVMDRCGAVRNCDIALELLLTANLQDPEISAALENERRREKKKLTAKLHAWQKDDVTNGWRRHLRPANQETGVWDLKQTTAENAHRVLPVLAKQLVAAGETAAAGSSHRMLHRFRLQVKRFRYTLEVFAPVYQDPIERAMTILQGLQDQLGAINDCATTLEMVKENREAVTAVHKLLKYREAAFRETWKQVAGELDACFGGKQSGTLHSKARRSAAAGNRAGGRKQEADRER